MHGVENFPRPGGATSFRGESPLSREWLAHPDRIEETFARPLPDRIGAFSVPSVFDLPLMPDGHKIDGAVDACPIPVIHPNLPYAPEFHTRVRRYLDGEDQPPCPWWRSTIGPIFRPFSAPWTGS